jgi:hypothetical protein
MEFFIRLLIKLLDYAYPKPKKSTVYGENAAEEAVLREYDDEQEERRKAEFVEQFHSSAEAVQGAVDYGELRWNAYTRVVETPEQFAFYSGPSIVKVIAKKELAEMRQIAALRRVIRRSVPECELRDD